MVDVPKLGKMIRFHRKLARLSQIELAQLSGVGKTAVFDIEKGKETIQLVTLLKILHTLNILIQFSGPLVNIFEKEYGSEKRAIAGIGFASPWKKSRLTRTDLIEYFGGERLGLTQEVIRDILDQFLLSMEAINLH